MNTVLPPPTGNITQFARADLTWATIGGSTVISWSTAIVALPNVGQTVVVVWDQTTWMMTGLSIALADANANFIASFIITSLNSATNTTTLLRTS